MWECDRSFRNEQAFRNHLASPRQVEKIERKLVIRVSRNKLTAHLHLLRAGPAPWVWLSCGACAVGDPICSLTGFGGLLCNRCLRGGRPLTVGKCCACFRQTPSAILPSSSKFLSLTSSLPLLQRSPLSTEAKIVDRTIEWCTTDYNIRLRWPYFILSPFNNIDFNYKKRSRRVTVLDGSGTRPLQMSLWIL